MAASRILGREVPAKGLSEEDPNCMDRPLIAQTVRILIAAGRQRQVVTARDIKSTEVVFISRGDHEASLGLCCEPKE